MAVLWCDGVRDKKKERGGDIPNSPQGWVKTGKLKKFAKLFDFVTLFNFISQHINLSHAFSSFHVSLQPCHTPGIDENM